MSDPRAVFLGRRSYAGRRMADAARLLPILGIFLVLLPALIGPGGGSMASTLIYLFAAWVVLLLAAALLSRRLGDRDPEEEE